MTAEIATRVAKTVSQVLISDHGDIVVINAWEILIVVSVPLRTLCMLTRLNVT